MPGDWLTVKEVVRQTGIADKTVRRYIDDFPEFIVTRRVGRVLMVSSDSLEIIEQIRYLYQEKRWDTARVRRTLQEMHPVNVTVVEQQSGVPILSRDDLIRMKEIIFEMAKEQQRLVQEQQKLLKRLEELEQRLLDDGKEIKETLSRVESYSQKRKGWWPWRRR